jgi:hypothetical protein
MACVQEVIWTMPSWNSTPAGVCIQLLADRIQNEEMKVPIATMQAANR